MRYAILSDIHSNLEAFKTVVEATQQQNIDQFVCCGDIVGYGANPVEALEMVKDLQMTSIAGNHDWAVSGKIDASYFTPAGRAAVEWSRSQIDFDDIEYLNSLQLTYENDHLTLVHGTLNNPENFTYLMDMGDAPDTFYLMKKNVCFIGHTHVPQIFIQRNNRCYYSDLLDLEIDSESKYIVNVGSVGQPRDGNPMASYCIYDTEMAMIEIKRIQYDISSAQEKILEAGLPDMLAQRLAAGQ